MSKATLENTELLSREENFFFFFLPLFLVNNFKVLLKNYRKAVSSCSQFTKQLVKFLNEEKEGLFNI